MMKNCLALTLLAFTLLPGLDPQQPEAISPNLLRLEGTDQRQHIHYLRFILLLDPPDNPRTTPDSLPRFTVECREQDSKRSLHLLVRFTGSPNFDFTPPEIVEAGANFAKMNPSTNLKMRFEGYTHSPEFKRQWEVLPSGELHYRNPGINSSNLDNPQFFW